MFYVLRVYFHYNHILSKEIGIICVKMESIYLNPTKLITFYDNIVLYFFETSKSDSDCQAYKRIPVKT